MLKRAVSLLAVVLLLSVLPVSAQDQNPDLPLAAVSDSQLYIYGGETPVLVQTPPVYSYNNLVWSPDGNILAFTLYEPTYFHSIMVYSMGQPSAVQIIGNLTMGLPISFTADGTQIVYAVPTGETTTDMMGSIHEVRTTMLIPGAESQVVGTFDFGVGCGGGSSIPADWLYWTETNGFGGNSLTLGLTPYGVVHSTNCTGNGIGLLDLVAGADTVLDETMSRAVVSPDRTQVIGLSNGILTLIRLDTREVIPLSAAATPDQISWGAPGSGDVFYSTRTSSGRPLVEGEAEQLKIAQALGYMDATTLDLPIWDVTIHRYNLIQNTDTQVYAGEAYAIGRMIAMPDSSALVFSQVPNLQAWAQAVLDGSFDPMSGASVEPYVFVTLYSLNLAANSVSVIGNNLNLAALNMAAVGQ
jgi:hypothetical protein